MAVDAASPAQVPQQRWLQGFTVGVVHLAVFVVYVFFATQGSWRFAPDDPQQISYAMLADSFLAGRTYLPVAPRSELLALPNPYDTEAHEKLILMDASLYGGRYYLYFGPAPALPHVVWQLLSGRPASYSGVTGLIYGYGTYLVLCGLIARLARWIWSNSSLLRLAPLVYLSIGLGGIAPYLQARPGIYHEAILAGGFFIILGYRVLLGEELSTGRLVIAGVLVAMGIAARYSLAGYAVAALVGIAAGNRTTRARRVLAFAAPLTVVTLALCAYNTVRFDRPWRFGGEYQLTGMIGATQRLDPRCFGRNVAAYVAYWPSFSAFFPYLLSQDEYKFDEPRWILEGNFASLLLTMPLLPLTVVGAQVVARRLRAPTRQIMLAMLVGSVATMLLIFCLGWAAMRYAQDFVPALLPFGALGIFALATRRARIATMLVIGALAMSLPVSLALAIAEMNSRFPGRSLANAYAFDRASRALLRAVRPRSWPASYLRELVARRPLGDDYWIERESRPYGLFAVEGFEQHVLAGDAAGFGQIDLESLFDHEVTVQVYRDGVPLPPVALSPGWQSFSMPGLENVRPGQEVGLRLTFPSEPPRRAGELWPVRIRGL